MRVHGSRYVCGMGNSFSFISLKFFFVSSVAPLRYFFGESQEKHTASRLLRCGFLWIEIERGSNELPLHIHNRNVVDLGA